MPNLIDVSRKGSVNSLESLTVSYQTTAVSGRDSRPFLLSSYSYLLPPSSTVFPVRTITPTLELSPTKFFNGKTELKRVVIKSY